MEVKLDKRYDLAVSAEQAWAVLQDIHAVARCMPGAQITEQLDATHYKGTVKSKVGPAVMQFGGDIEVLGLDAAAKSMQMLGKGADNFRAAAAAAVAAPRTSVVITPAPVKELNAVALMWTVFKGWVSGLFSGLFGGKRA